MTAARRPFLRWSIVSLFTVLLLAEAGVAVADPPLVGLAGEKYRRAYVGIIEQLGGESEQVSGAELEDPEALSNYTALVVVTRGEAGQETYGFTDAADAAVAQYVKGGGRVLCSFGCSPPKVMLGGRSNTGGWGRGPDWVVTDNTHPITAGMQLGQIVRYGAYRCRIASIEPPGKMLLADIGGSTAVAAIPYGDGEVIQTNGDLGHGGADATSNELRYRLMLYLLYGKGQERFGPDVPAPTQEPQQRPQLYTPRQLALDAAQDAGYVFKEDFDGQAPAGELDYGYRANISQAADGAGSYWAISAPEGNQTFAPWLRVPISEAQVEAGQTYRLSLKARITGVARDVLAPARAELRFYDAEGRELSHPHISTGDAPKGEEWAQISTQTVAPEAAVKATVALSGMLPSGALQLDDLVLRRAMTTAEIFAGEKPLAGQISGHPRAIVSPEIAAKLPARAADTTEGVYGASPASLLAVIRARADKYLQETEIKFGKSSLPWPPQEMPQEGGGLSWNPLAGALSERLKSLSLVYAATGNAGYGNRAKELLVAICEWPQWYDPVNNRPSLEIGNISIAACFAYDLCYDLLSEDERAFVAEALQRNVLVPLHEALSPGIGNSNGYALWTTALGLCAVATLGETAGAATCVRLAEDCVLDYWDKRANSHRTEGQGYDSWAYGLLIFLADSLKRNFGVDHLGHPFLPVMARFGIAFLANDWHTQAWFADAGGSAQYVVWHFPLTLLGAYTHDGNAGWYLRETKTVGYVRWDHYKFIAFDPQTPVIERDPQRPGDIFPRVGWASLRSGWEQDGTFIALQCSSSGQGHAHMDQNNFLIYRSATAVAMDCGYASSLGGALREFARGAVGHNCILVDGKMQTHKRGNIPYFATTRHVDYAMGDATGAYSSSLLSRAHRHLIYLKPDLLLMVDDLKAAGQARSFQWLVHPHSWGGMAQVTRAGKEMLVGEPATPGDVEIVKADKQMRIRFLHPARVPVEYVTYPGAEKYNPYIQANIPPTDEVVLVTLLELGETHAEDVSTIVSNRLVVFSCNANDKAHQVMLNLAGDAGESPHLKVELDGETLLDRDDLTIPPDVTG